MDISNYAVSGQTVSQMVGEYATEAHASRPEISGFPGWFIMEGGINDIPSRSAASIYADLKALWAAARADGYMVCATTIYSWTVNSDYRQSTETINELILSDPSLYDAIARFDYVLTGYDPDLYMDAVHANSAGRRLLAVCIFEAISG